MLKLINRSITVEPNLKLSVSRRLVFIIYVTNISQDILSIPKKRSHDSSYRFSYLRIGANHLIALLFRKINLISI